VGPGRLARLARIGRVGPNIVSSRRAAAGGILITVLTNIVVAARLGSFSRDSALETALALLFLVFMWSVQAVPWAVLSQKKEVAGASAIACTVLLLAVGVGFWAYVLANLGDPENEFSLLLLLPAVAAQTAIVFAFSYLARRSGDHQRGG
jgi:hypothetical protein